MTPENAYKVGAALAGLPRSRTRGYWFSSSDVVSVNHPARVSRSPYCALPHTHVLAHGNTNTSIVSSNGVLG